MSLVRERILQDIETALGQISTANGFGNDVKSVQRWMQHGNSLYDTPCIIVAAGPEEQQSGPFPLVSCDLSVELTLWYRQPEDDTTPTDSYLNSLLQDIIRALYADYTRGGLAQDTEIVSVLPFESIEGQPYAGLIIEVQVKYRFVRSNPEQAG